MEQLLKDAPAALAQSNVLLDLQVKFTATKAGTEEQLSDAYSRCVAVTPHELTVLPSVQVGESTQTLPRTLSSLSPTSLDNHLTILRRDITNHYINTLPTQPMSIVADHNKLTIYPSPPNDNSLHIRIQNLSQTLHFLSTHLLIHLPSSFSKSLTKPVTNSVLNNLLILHLPTSFNYLPPFIDLLNVAVNFEDECVIGLLLGDDDSTDRPIKAWVEAVGAHYERQRRVLLLDKCRKMILEPTTPEGDFQAEVMPVQAQEVVPIQVEEQTAGGWGFEEEEPLTENGDQDGWNDNPDTATMVDDDSWGFDDDTDAADPPETNGHNPEVEPEDADAWGLDEELDPGLESLTNETNWDDPWGEGESSALPAPPPSVKPKAATKLEKLANKSKGAKGEGNVTSPVVSSSSSLPSASLAETRGAARPPNLTTSAAPPKPPPKEVYLVSSRMNDILLLVRETLRESKEFAFASADQGLLKLRTRPPSPSHLLSSSPVPGSILYQTSAIILDLYRALLPVVLSAQSESLRLEWPMRTSNNCVYLSGEVQLLKRELEGGSGFEGEMVKVFGGRFDECGHAFKVLGDSLYSDAIVSNTLCSCFFLNAGLC